MILFRQVDHPLPPGCHPFFEHWQVEYHPDQHPTGYPWGLAWVTTPAPAAVAAHFPAPPPDDPAARSWLAYVLVADNHRRQGIATALLEACRQRWPRLLVLPPTTATGRTTGQALHPLPPPAAALLPYPGHGKGQSRGLAA